MTEYAIYNSSTNRIRFKLGSSIPQKIVFNGDIVYSAELGHENNGNIVVSLVDDTSGNINRLYEWSEWSPIIYDPNTHTVTRTGVYTEKPDNEETRRIYENLIWDEFDRRMSLKVSATVSSGRDVEIKIKHNRDFQNLLSFALFAQMLRTSSLLGVGASDTFTLKDINGADQVLTQDELMEFLKAYAIKREAKLRKAYALIDNPVIQYDYNNSGHW